MSCNSFLLFTALVLFLVSRTAWGSELEPLWEIARGGSDVGGCDEDLNNLKASYKEAISLVRRAIDVLEEIKNPRPFEDEDELSLSDAELQSHETWTRHARLAKAMFGIDADPAKGINEANSIYRLNYVLDSFRSVVQYADDKDVPAGLKRRVYCSPKGFAHLPPGTLFPGTEEVVNSEKSPNGLFAIPPFLPYWEKWSVYSPEPEGTTDPVEDWCGDEAGHGSTLAATIETYRLVGWCELGLRGAPILLDNIAINEGDRLPETSSNTWVHELMHVWTMIVPDRKTSLTDEGAARDEGGIVHQVDHTAAYGFLESAQLARLLPDKAILNADSHAVFATAVWLDKWDWATADRAGKATKI